jgi:hypothetical protein
MADESSSKDSSVPAVPATPAPSTSTWKLPDGIEDHIESGMLYGTVRTRVMTTSERCELHW